MPTSLTPRPEEELALLFLRTAAWRAGAADRMRTLAQRADLDRFEQLVWRQRVHALALSRLRDLTPELVEGERLERLEDEVAAGRLRGGVTAVLTLRVAETLEQRGIPVVPIKGALLAERLYAHAGLRAPSVDIDFVVRPSDMKGAVRALATLEYVVRDPITWTRGLPHYHFPLIVPGRAWPRVELHWRVHWYERTFSGEAVERSRTNGDCRRMVPADELATLLLIYARDGFTSLRMAADLAAWWDAYGDQLPEAALEPVLERHPRLQSALLAAAEAAAAVTAIPRDGLIAPTQRLGWRARAAVRLVDWRGRADEQQVPVNITLVDLLLTPLGSAGVFVRHYWFQPLGKYAEDYGWSPRTRVRNELRRLLHAAARAGKSTRSYVQRLWSLRGGRAWDPLPDNRKQTAR